MRISRKMFKGEGRPGGCARLDKGPENKGAQIHTAPTPGPLHLLFPCLTCSSPDTCELHCLPLSKSALSHLLQACPPTSPPTFPVLFFPVALITI